MIKELKKQVCNIAKKAQDEGLCKHKSGNFSARDPKTGYIVISPSGIDREILQPKDMIVMSGYEVIENLSNLKPSSEVLVHLAIYEKRKDVNAIVHTHSKYATAFAVMNEPIPAIVFEISTLGLKSSYVPVAEYALPGTDALANNVADATLKSDAVLMERHGTICVADTVDQAFLKAGYLEELAEIYFITQNIKSKNNLKVFDIQEFENHKYPDRIVL